MLNHGGAEFPVPADNSLRLITTRMFRASRGLAADCGAISHNSLHVSNSVDFENSEN